MKTKLFALLLSISIITMSFISVSAATMSKSLTATYSTTKIKATATYYTHETGRWSLGNPQILSTSGKGGGASKSGAAKTSQSGNEYKVRQNYSISATNDNYVTTTGVKTFQWVVNGSTNSWVTSKCYVTNS